MFLADLKTIEGVVKRMENIEVWLLAQGFVSYVYTLQGMQYREIETKVIKGDVTSLHMFKLPYVPIAVLCSRKK